MPPVSSPEDALKAVEMCSRAQQPRETLVRRTLRRVLALAVQDNDGTLPHVVGPLNRLATVLPAESLAGDAAATPLSARPDARMRAAGCGWLSDDSCDVCGGLS